ncbi:MAG TPA: DUF3160 domain-containing protein [Gemmatales bacterium]|nr:DUF3160 domain-containing protein [Gemmatales bacterium]
MDPPTKHAKANVDGLGYGVAFDDEIAQLGQITTEQFSRRYALPDNYLKQLSIDPTQAKYFDKFQLIDSILPKDLYGQPCYDFKLHPAEMDIFTKQGFVVSERMNAPSFAEIYYRLFSRDLPVFISTDSVLHAWHRSFDSILMETETLALAPTLEIILKGMSDKLKEARQEYGNGVLSDGMIDVDYFLAVALSLLKGAPYQSQFGQDARVAETLKACDSLGMLLQFPLFGRARDMDFSQFKPRGHYEKTVPLQRYFRAMMWCGRIDLRMAGNPKESSPREMAAAIVMNDLLRRSGQFQKWTDFDQALQTFVGKADSMTFAQLDGVLREAKMQDPRTVKDLESLTSLQQQIELGKIGLQQIRGDVYESPSGSMKVTLPRSFAVLGQRFVLDSWALSKVVYDDIKWDNEKVERRIPSALDVAFSTFNNRHVVPELVSRILDTKGREFRDGLNYQHNLAAVHNVIESQQPKAWETNLYSRWLDTLRELSQPTTDSKYPEAMRTTAWSMKSLNTQLGSWTQLRHDTVLYAKQSYTGMASCVYPAGYVEPLPHFWTKMEKMAQHAADAIEKLSFHDIAIGKEPHDAPGIAIRMNQMPQTGKPIKEAQSKFLRNFALQLSILKDISTRELNRQELTSDELKFLKEVVQTEREGSGTTKYGGWYPKLFYNGKTDSGIPDALVADVHTDVPDGLTPDPGCILNQGVGNIDFLLVAIESREGLIVYGSGVLSHYEFETPTGVRLTDSEWAKNLSTGQTPPRPSWTKSYLAPFSRVVKP